MRARIIGACRVGATGAIGPISEVHVWVNATYGGKERPTDTPPVPPQLHYDLWLGPVASRPYSPEYLPINWRTGGPSAAERWQTLAAIIWTCRIGRWDCARL